MFLPLVAKNMSRNCKYLSWNDNRAPPTVMGADTGTETQSSRVAVQPGFLSYHAEKALTKENGISGERKKPSWIDPSPRIGSGHPVCHAGPSSSTQPQHTFSVQRPCFAVIVTFSNVDVKSSGLKPKSDLSNHDGNISFTQLPL